MNRETMKKISVNEIIKKISEEAAVRKAEGPRFSRQDRLHTRTSKSNHANPLKQETRLYRFAKKVQHKTRKYPFYSFVYNTAYKFKQFIPKYDASIGIGEFLQYHDEEFIKNAYQRILGREPDPQGFHHNLIKLRDGHLSKTAILGNLRYSNEGKEKKVVIRGLRLRYIIERTYRLPGLGYVLNLLSILIRLPKILKNIQQYEAFTSARFTQQVETSSRLALDIHKVSVDTSANIQNIQKVSGEATTNIKAVSDDVKRVIAEAIALIKIDLDKAILDARATYADMQSKIVGLQDSKAEAQIVSKLIKLSRDQSIDILNLQNNLRNLFEDMRKKLSRILPAGHIEELQKEEEHLLDALYVAFEDRFRGERADIKERMRVYLSYIERIKAGTDDAIVLDIGCGRGEWLELLRDNRFKAKGIDNNGIMVNQCQGLGLDVINCDVIQYLRDQKPDTFGAITGLHIVEHLPLPVLVQLLDEVRRTLKPGGVAIFETPNPENMMVGATFFHIDPTHDKPVHPLTMDFLMGQRGFSKIEIIRLHAMPGQSVDNEMLHNLLFGPQDYAAIGYKE